MSNEELDIYADIDDFDLGEKVKTLQDEVSKLHEQIKEKNELICTLQAENKDVLETNRHLISNISSLMKTAKVESTRKDKIIADLRKEKDEIIFRRNKNVTNIKTDKCGGITGFCKNDQAHNKKPQSAHSNSPRDVSSHNENLSRKQNCTKTNEETKGKRVISEDNRSHVTNHSKKVRTTYSNELKDINGDTSHNGVNGGLLCKVFSEELNQVALSSTTNEEEETTHIIQSISNINSDTILDKNQSSSETKIIKQDLQKKEIAINRSKRSDSSTKENLHDRDRKQISSSSKRQHIDKTNSDKYKHDKKDTEKQYSEKNISDKFYEKRKCYKERSDGRNSNERSKQLEDRDRRKDKERKRSQDSKRKYDKIRENHHRSNDRNSNRDYKRASRSPPYKKRVTENSENLSNHDLKNLINLKKTLLKGISLECANATIAPGTRKNNVETLNEFENNMNKDQEEKSNSTSNIKELVDFTLNTTSDNMSELNQRNAAYDIQCINLCETVLNEPSNEMTMEVQNNTWNVKDITNTIGLTESSENSKLLQRSSHDSLCEQNSANSDTNKNKSINYNGQFNKDADSKTVLDECTSRKNDKSVDMSINNVNVSGDTHSQNDKSESKLVKVNTDKTVFEPTLQSNSEVDYKMHTNIKQENNLIDNQNVEKNNYNSKQCSNSEAYNYSQATVENMLSQLLGNEDINNSEIDSNPKENDNTNIQDVRKEGSTHSIDLLNSTENILSILSDTMNLDKSYEKINLKNSIGTLQDNKEKENSSISSITTLVSTPDAHVSKLNVDVEVYNTSKDKQEIFLQEDRKSSSCTVIDNKFCSTDLQNYTVHSSSKSKKEITRDDIKNNSFTSTQNMKSQISTEKPHTPKADAKTKAENKKHPGVGRKCSKVSTSAQNIVSTLLCPTDSLNSKDTTKTKKSTLFLDKGTKVKSISTENLVSLLSPSETHESKDTKGIVQDGVKDAITVNMSPLLSPEDLPNLKIFENTKDINGIFQDEVRIMEETVDSQTKSNVKSKVVSKTKSKNSKKKMADSTKTTKVSSTSAEERTSYSADPKNVEVSFNSNDLDNVLQDDINKAVASILRENTESSLLGIISTNNTASNSTETSQTLHSTYLQNSKPDSHNLELDTKEVKNKKHGVEVCKLENVASTLTENLPTEIYGAHDSRNEIISVSIEDNQNELDATKVINKSSAVSAVIDAVEGTTMRKRTYDNEQNQDSNAQNITHTLNTTNASESSDTSKSSTSTSTSPNLYTLSSRLTKYECAVDNRNSYSIKLNRVRRKKIS